MKNWLVLSVLGIVLSLAGVSFAQSERGIYELGNGHITDACVDGALFFGHLNTINTAPGVYDWSAIDKLLPAVRAAGKHYTLAFDWGIKTPVWYYTTVSSLTLSIGTVPVVWDPAYLSKVAVFIAAAGAHYNSDVALSAIKFSGLDFKTSETHIIGKTTIDNVQWLDAGYSAALLESSFQALLADWRAAFPNREELAGILPAGGWPLTATLNDSTLNTLLADQAGANWYWQFDGLGPVLKLKGASAGMKGYQENKSINGNVAQLQAEANLVQGQASANFFEVYDNDVVDSVLCPLRSVLLAR